MIKVGNNVNSLFLIFNNLLNDNLTTVTGCLNDIIAIKLWTVNILLLRDKMVKVYSRVCLRFNSGNAGEERIPDKWFHNLRTWLEQDSTSVLTV